MYTVITLFLLLLSSCLSPLIDGTPTTQINKVLSHPTLPIIITAHEDKYICFFDSKSGMHLRGGGGREKERGRSHVVMYGAGGRGG